MLQTCAVSGASGFIGSYLKKYLENRYYEVIPIKRELLYNSATLNLFLNQVRPDYIVHLAAYGNMSNQNNFEETANANILSTYNLLQATKDIPYKKFINVSSSSVYGITRNTMSEDDRLNPETPYATTKAAAELIVKGFRNHYGKNIITVRPFSVYGDGEAPFRFIPTVIRSIKNGTPITLYEGHHDWIYIDDFARALNLLMEKKTYEDTYNIGTGVSVSNRVIVKTIEKIMGNPAIISEIKPSKREDSDIWVANINRLILHGFVPNFNLYNGLLKTVEYYGKNLSN